MLLKQQKFFVMMLTDTHKHHPNPKQLYLTYTNYNLFILDKTTSVHHNYNAVVFINKFIIVVHKDDSICTLNLMKNYLFKQMYSLTYLNC